MSIAQMTVAWRLQGLTPTQKLVLLSLADNASDAGECYPSVAQIAQRTGLSDRAVQKTVASLQELHLLTRITRPGTSTLYLLTLDESAAFTPEQRSPQGRTTFTPEPGSPPNVVHHTPERGSPPPPNVVHPTPERGSPKPSLNRQLNRQGTVKAKRTPAPTAPEAFGQELPDWLPRDEWAMFDRFRRAKSAKAWTADAQQLALRTLAKLRDAGNDPAAVLAQSVERGWTGLFPVRDQQQRSHQGAPAPSVAQRRSAWGDALTQTLDNLTGTAPNPETFDAYTGNPV